MKVAFNPSISFKENLIEEAKRNSNVIAETGWGNPNIERESDEKLTKYVEQMKNSAIPGTARQMPQDQFSRSTTNDYPPGYIYPGLHTGSWVSDEARKKEHANLVQELEKSKNLIDAQLANDVAEFKEALKSRKWKRTYLKESDVIWVEQKHVKNGVAYCLEKDGTVKKTSPNEGKSEVIIEANKDMSKTFNDIKAKESKPKKSIGYRIRDAIGDTWKFFSATGTMTIATAKGIVYGAGAGVGVVAAATLLKLITHPRNIKEILKHPLNAAGKTGKILAGTAAAILLVSNIIAGKLQANENTAVIEHKMNTDHRYD